MHGDDVSAILLVVGAIGLIIITQPPSAVVGAVGPGYEGYTKYAKPAPKLTSRFQGRTGQSNPTTPKRISVTGGGSKQHTRIVRKWTSVSQIPPATRRRLVNTWIAYARRVALARLRQILASRPTLQRVQYTGGLGGQYTSNPTGGAGAVSPDILKTFEENMGLKPIGNAPITEAQKRLESTATGVMQDILDCGDNDDCRAPAVRKFTNIITTNATSTANNLPQLRGQFDPTQATA